MRRLAIVLIAMPMIGLSFGPQVRNMMLEIASRRDDEGYAANQFVTTWGLTEDTEAGRTITLPLRTGFTYDFEVDWGDGNTSMVTAFDDADRIHTYSETGPKTVTMTGTLQAWHFNNGGDSLKFRSVEHWGADVGFTGLGLVSAFMGCANATSYADMPYYAVTSLDRTWFRNNALTNAADVSKLTDVNNLFQTWLDCVAMPTAPEVNILTAVTTLHDTWYNCGSMTNAPAVDQLTKVKTLRGAWYNTGISSAPAVNTLTNVTTLERAWQNCSSLTNAPAVDQLVKVTSLANAWNSCGLLTSAPAVNTLTNVTTLVSAWQNCSSLTNAPAVDQLTKVQSISFAWRNVPLETIPALMPSSTALTNVRWAFNGVGAQMAGTVVELWNATNFPNITSFDDTFTGATGLTNYDDIPDNWKGL